MLVLCVQVVKQCVSTEGVLAPYIREEILPEFFKAFWTRRMALDRWVVTGVSTVPRYSLHM
jgi:splicing factor 3B subunit 1